MLQRVGGHTERVSGFAAVTPGTDLGRHALVLRQAHDVVLSGGRAPGAVRPVVARSWARVLDAGVRPDVANARDPLPVGETEARRRRSRLRLVVDEVAAIVESVAEASHFLLVVTDADGVVLWRRGSSAQRRRADTLGFVEGATWTEASVGTNAIGTALEERAAVQLFSAEHFEQHQHPWYCTASPVHDPVTGDLLGVVDVSGPALSLHPAVLALVETAVRLAQVRLEQLHAASLRDLRERSAAMLPNGSAPFVLVDDDGWVAHATGLAAPARVAAPRQGVTQALAGLGACLPERVGAGWLLRPAAPRGRPRAVLAAGGLLTIEHGDEQWTVALSARHAELLRRLVAAGPTGLTAGALGRQLYGDDGHEVTVRAEVSRLRRVVGDLVQSSPYRVSEQLDVTIEAPPTSS